MSKIRSLEELESEWSEMESEWEMLKSQMKKRIDRPKEEENIERSFLIPSNPSSSDSEKEEYQKPISTIPFEIKYEEILRDYKPYHIGDELNFITSNTYICSFYNGIYNYPYGYEGNYWKNDHWDDYQCFVLANELNQKAHQSGRNKTGAFQLPVYGKLGLTFDDVVGKSLLDGSHAANALYIDYQKNYI
jgi:hypothetical protein